MMNIVKIFKDYGGLGVLSVWLLMTNSRVDKLEKQLQDCNNSKIDIYRELTKPISRNKNFVRIVSYAVIPDKVKFKKESYV